MKKYLGWMAWGATLVCQSVWAADFSFSGFGTVGYAQSDQPYNYQRFVNKTGTFKRDTVLLGQMDAQFNAQWGATVQAKLSPSLSNDQSWQATLPWVFLSYRPSNDLLIRAGKLRVPLYMNSENMDVDAVYSAAQLPIEVYSLTPALNFTGASFVKTWAVGEHELNLDGYWGTANTNWRFYQRDAATPIWYPMTADSKGLLLTLHRNEDTYRVGLHQAGLKMSDGQGVPQTLNPVPLNPATTGLVGNASAQVLSLTPLGYPAPLRSLKMTMNMLNLGADIAWGDSFRTVGEFARTRSKGAETDPDGDSLYLSLVKNVGAWTPYITYAQIRTRNTATYSAVNTARVAAVSPLVPPALVAGINAGQRAIADVIAVYDQHSWIIGTSYALNKKSKIKAEWIQVRTGVASSFVNAPIGGESGNQLINVYAVSYSFLF